MGLEGLLLTGELGVHRVRGELDVAGPSDGAGFQEDLPEESRIAQGGQDAGEFSRI